MSLVLIALGGAIGAVARYGLSGLIQERAGFFPLGTLVVNVLGSFLLGFAFRYLEAVVVHPELRLAVTVGLLGAFTTFSTFSYEAVGLVQDGDWGRAGAYVLGSVVLGLLAVLGGLAVANLSLQVR